MGFAQGSDTANQIVRTVREVLPTDPVARRRVYDTVIDAFEEIDCDTLEEVVDCFEFDDPVWAEAMIAHGYTGQDDFDGPLWDKEDGDEAE